MCSRCCRWIVKASVVRKQFERAASRREQVRLEGEGVGGITERRSSGS